MIVNDLNYIRDLNLIALLFENQTLRVNKVNRELVFPVSLEGMTSSDLESYHFLYCF